MIVKAEDFDKRFGTGEDLFDKLDFSNARRVNQEPQRLSIDFPAWMVAQLDKQSKIQGIPSNELVKTWIAERLKEAFPGY